MKKTYQIFSAAGIAILLLIGSALIYLWQDYQLFLHKPVTVAKLPVTVSVERGASFKSLASSLGKQGIYTNIRYLRWHARSQDMAHKIKAGKYTFKQAPTPEDLMQRLVGGQVDLFSLTIVEGWTFLQMLDAIGQSPHIVHSIQGLSKEQVMVALGKPDEFPEGLFLPDTYHFPEDTKDMEFLKRAMDTMTRYLEQAWEERDEKLPLKSPYEALILASIIEKETGAAHERPQISGVFIRRLKKGMRLQTDPTVIYGMGDKFDGNIRRRDLRADTPYNTYTRFGLPPTPIALPGKAAIDAALHPADGKSLYFVAKGDGTHYFSDTLEEHNKAVARYQLGEK